MLCPVDRQFYKALASGDKERINAAFKSVYDEYSRLVAFVAAKYIGDKETIKELVNDVFLRAFNHARDISGSLKYYLVVSAKNAAIDRSKRENRFKTVPLSYADREGEEDFAFSETAERLKEILGEADADLVLLHAVDGYSFKELAEMKNMNPNTVLTRYHRAIKKLKREGGYETE